MFSWSFSKPAEAMFSRWAIKRVCKFLLKKKLGKYILGDIDLNQLDVQLGAGTIKLSDLAINVDYLNEKFGTAPILVKEGSVGLLTVTMPWKESGCRIEVDELEIVLAPGRIKVSEDEVGSCNPSRKEKDGVSSGSRKINIENVNSGGASGFVGVHDGVKAIASWVKWLLTSFHVKIKKLIVAFDPLLEEENSGFDRILVFHLSEIECGTHISEDDSASNNSGAPSFLGSSRLTNFVRFHGARLELLHLDGRGPQPTTESAMSDSFTGCCSAENVTTVIAGEKGGFSGSLKLSLPWKNGSLDIHKVDADLDIEPIDLMLQASTIRCFIFMWGLFEGAWEHREESGHLEPSENFSSTSCWAVSSDKGFLGKEGSVDKNCLNDNKPANFLLSESEFISDWVTRSHKDEVEDEIDFGASVDQFFECFDELRSSQSALGNSEMWNWTRSVFSAITATSNLASGSLHVPSVAEQLHVETKFNATIAKVCLHLSFNDEDQKQSEVKDDKAFTGFQSHVVCAELVDLVFVLQVRPQEMNFDVIVQHIQLVDHLCWKSMLMNCNVHDSGDCENEIALIQKIQHDVQGALFAYLDPDKEPNVNYQQVDISLGIRNTERCFHMTNGNNICGNVTLLKTSGVTQCHVRMNSDSSGSSSVGPISLSLELAPFVCWLSIDLITIALKFLTANCFETTGAGNGLVLKSEAEWSGPSTFGNRGKISRIRSKNTSTKNSFKGNILISNARLLLCFPLKEYGDSSIYSSYDQVIAFDFISPAIGVEKVRSSKPLPVSSLDNENTGATSCSLNVHFSNFFIFSISSGFKEKIVGSETHSREEANYTVEKILSAVDKSEHLSLLSIYWQAGSKTGPWIAQKAKHLASSENGRRMGSVVTKNSEFASVTTSKDIIDYDNRSRQEIFSSSTCFLHARLPPIVVSLGKSQYGNINALLNQMFDQISSVFSDSVSISADLCASQSSVFLECDSLTVAFAVEPLADVKSSIRSELSGSWLSLTLQVDKFEFISASNIGGIEEASFLWVSHHQGSLRGSAECVNQEFLLISCSNSALGRGDGVGSNVLCSGHAGSDFVHFWDPNSNHDFVSITVRGATIVANGGRLDWFRSISSFFALPSDEFDQTNDNRKEKTSGSSFILNLVDAGLSYEPYLKKLKANQDSEVKSLNSNSSESEDKYIVACLLAASYLKLSSTSLVDCPNGDYKIRLQDLGLLLCPISQEKLIGGTYSAQHLGQAGYVKVAQEPHVEVLLRTNCENGHVWELECVESHIMLGTCHDTTFGLIALAGQLQKLFAPDMQDYVVHLENRWNNSQKVNERSNEETSDCESASFSLTEASSVDKRSNIGNLMDEVLEDVFQLDRNCDSRDKLFGSHLHTFDNDSHVFCAASSSEDKIPDIMDEYFLSDLRPLPEITVKNQSSDVIYYETGAIKEVQMRRDGWYRGTSLRILDNHLSKVEHTSAQKPIHIEDSLSDSETSNVGKVEGRIYIKNMNVMWRMYDGSDWRHIQSTFQTSAMARGRDSAICMELSLSGLGFDCDVYPDGEVCASTISLTVQDLCLNDKSANAPWKLVLGCYQSKKHPRISSSNAVKLNLKTVRPEPSIHIEENRLRIAFLPLRLHLHQNQLDFFIKFFGGKSPLVDDPSTSSSIPLEPLAKDNLHDCTINEEAFLTYFQKFDISPMLIRVDYSPCRFDLTALRGGKYVELVNLVPWKGVELKLKHVQGVGLYGWGSVCETTLGEWLEDISQNQVHKLLKGLPPIKSLVAVGSGAAKLVTLPMKSYKKDRRLLKGVQRGAFAFLRSISLEAIGLGVHLAAGAHDILLQAEYILASIPPSVPWPADSRCMNVKSNQPMDVLQGLQQACQSISDGLGKSASALVQTPLKKYQRGAGIGSAVASAVQSAPAAAIAPASAAAHAMHCALLGIRNSLNPEHKRESLEKYAGASPSHESMQ